MLDKVNVDQKWKKLEEKHAELYDSYEKVLTASTTVENVAMFTLRCIIQSNIITCF